MQDRTILSPWGHLMSAQNSDQDRQRDGKGSWVESPGSLGIDPQCKPQLAFQCVTMMHKDTWDAIDACLSPMVVLYNA